SPDWRSPPPGNSAGMRRVLLAVALLLFGTAPLARAETLPIRPARPADDVRHESLSESWQVLAFDPATRTWVRIQFVATPWTDFELWIRQGDDIVHGVGSSGMGIAPQASPGISMVETSPLDPSSPPKASLVF